MSRRLLLVLLLAAGWVTAQDEGGDGEKKPEESGATSAPETAAEPDSGMADHLPRPGDAAPAPPVDADQDHARTWEIEGYLSTRLRFESAAGDDVLRLFVDLNADAHHKGELPYTIRVNGRAGWTVTDKPDPDSYVFGIWDTFGGRLNGVLYELFVSFPEVINKKSRITLGRQFIDEGVYLHFDGARVDLGLDHLAPDLEVSIYGGAGVEWGEEDGQEHWLVGVLGKGSIPQWKTRWRLQYLFVNQHFDGINDPSLDPLVDYAVYPAQTLEDHLVGVSIWQPFGESTRFFGRFTLLNGDANELNLRLRWANRDGRWTLLAEWYQLFQRLFNVTNDLTPYVPLLGSLDPFFRASIRATWRPRHDLVVELGGAWRALDDEQDEGPFNREWFNYYATFTWLELWKERVDLTLTASGYDTDGSSQQVITSNVDVRLKEKLLLSLGLDYALYKYDWFSNSERENVWTYRGELQWDPTPSLRGNLGIYVDDDRVTTWTYFVARLTWRF